MTLTSKEKEEILKRLEELRKVRETQPNPIDEEKGKDFYQLFCLTIGTFGAIAFAGVVLVIQNKADFSDFTSIVFSLGATTILAMFSALFSILAGSRQISANSPHAWLAFGLGGVSFLCMIFGVLFAIKDSSSLAGWSVAGVIGAVCILYFLAPSLARMKSRRAR